MLERKALCQSQKFHILKYHNTRIENTFTWLNWWAIFACCITRKVRSSFTLSLFINIVSIK